MKELVGFITYISDSIKAGGNRRLIYYLLIAIAAALVFLLLPGKEVSFVYNEF